MHPVLPKPLAQGEVFQQAARLIPEAKVLVKDFFLL
jgi:hypothetical protein